MLGTTRLFPGDLGHEPPLHPPERKELRCPVCGGLTNELVRDRWGDTVGCPDCVELYNAADDTQDALAYFWNGGL